MSSQDKAGPQDGTEDAATEGRAPDTAKELPETPQSPENEGDADIEDAEFVSESAHADDEAIAGDPAEDGGEAAGIAEEDPSAGEDDSDGSQDGTGQTTTDTADIGDAPETEDTRGDDAETREDLAAAALSGSAAGAALGAGASGGGAVSDPEPARPAASPPPAPQKSGGGFMPALLGGVVAAGLGAGGMFYFGDMLGGDERLEQALAAQDSQLSALDTKLTDLSEAMAAPDDSGTDDQIAALGDRLGEQLGGVADRIETLAGTVSEVQDGLASLDTRLADVNDRLTVVEQRPLTESSEAAQAAFSAYEDDIAELQAALEEQTAANEELAAQLEQRAADAQAEVDAAAARAAELQAQAEEQARVAMEQAEARARTAAVREAMASLDAALERGTPFAAPLEVLSEGVEVPQALSDAAADGVASLPDLRATFPDLARDALDASIRETVDDDLTERAVAFLKAQTGFRSLAPREGDDPDAVLSRAEAALQDGDLAASISELSQLPPAGQAVMADWIARAEQRRTVTEAAGTLADTLLAN